MALRSLAHQAPDRSCETPSLVINGRFLGQTLSGVQRFAYEMARALVEIWPQTPVSPVVLRPFDHPAPAWPLSIQCVGRRQGVLWEQLDLPRFSVDGLLLNLANTAPIMGRRQAVVIHDMGAFETPQAYSLAFRTYYRLLQRLIARTDIKVATVSEFSRLAISKHLGIPKQNISVVGEGSDHMHRLQSDLGTLTRHQLIPGGYVLAVGNLARHKNLASLSELAVMLERRGVLLVIAGQVNAVFQADGLKLPTPARYLGRVSDEELKALYEGAACFVFPSMYEGFGLPTVEAMACGCVVLSSAIPGLQETCGEAALFFDPASPADIAAKVARVLDDPALADRLRWAGTARADELTWGRAAELLKAALLRRSAPLADEVSRC